LQIARRHALVSRKDIPLRLEHEMQIATAKAREEGKPEPILPRIVRRVDQEYKDETVADAPAYIRDDTKTIQDLLNEAIVSLGENIIIRRFTRWRSVKHRKSSQNRPAESWSFFFVRRDKIGIG